MKEHFIRFACTSPSIQWRKAVRKNARMLLTMRDGVAVSITSSMGMFICIILFWLIRGKRTFPKNQADSAFQHVFATNPLHT